MTHAPLMVVYAITYSHLKICYVARYATILGAQSVVTQWNKLPGKAEASAIGVLVGWGQPFTNSLDIDNLDIMCEMESYDIMNSFYHYIYGMTYTCPS